MSSLVERLRLRTDRRPIYNLDDSDDDDFVPKKDRTLEQVEAIVRADAKENACQACGESANLISCNTCTYAYHAKCLVPPVKGPAPENWRCPECVSPLSEMEKMLDCEVRPTVPNDDQDSSTAAPKQIFVKQYLVKWKGLSYLHCTWVPEQEFQRAYKSNPRLRTRVNNFHRQMASANNNEDDFVAIRPEWTTVDRIIARRGEDDEKEYLVKYKELSYDECYWESESDISAFQNEIQRFNDINSRSRRVKEVEHKSNPKEFQQFDHSPVFLRGSLHPYQLEGLNFLRFSWLKQTHVILADEMGLGKTIQSIAFLASLFEENLAPHLVVAPLSTLRNWEREFATWAPHMNVVMYFGAAQARAIIREHEFYFPKGHQKIKKKKSGQISGETKQDRIKFDVLLTSYEMINLDTAVLKPIKWECMIVDEGHRLKNKDSKLFSSLKQYASNHRVLLTGTPLQNNLDELFMLMHFLDAGKFVSLEEFQEEFKDINQEEQISRLHKMLAPHLLRRVKKDVMKDMPPKKELILRVDLSSQQKEYYKAILTRNYQVLTRKGGAQISLINVVMELRKLCCHPYMLEGVDPNIEDPNEAYRQLLESSGKLQLLDKMMVKLKEQGHRVLIYTQFQHMLDLLEDYCTYKNWLYERIDGKVGGAERQIRIDRFNAKNSNRFCFLLSTRAGGLGINLATADTVIIYDSDWNPHADLQAMARAHRLGQTNKVMIYRLITRGTIEERMMQMTKKKMVLEHLVVGKLKTQNINQEELDDIIRYGSKELFADENDEAGKSGKIHYDDAAIDKLLDRDHVDAEEASMDDEEENGFLKAFKVANFEYIDESDAAAQEAERLAAESKTSIGNSDRTSYWEELLKDKYEVHRDEELNSLGKRKRSRKQMVPIEEDDLAGFEDVSSDGEDECYETELTDGETAGQGNPSGRRPYRRRARDNSEPTPLMEGEGRSFRVLGFNQSQRAVFVKTLMRYGIGNCDWKEFVPRLKQKTYEEIKEYGTLFLKHIVEDIDESSPTFSDGVPKEGLRIEDVLVRIAILGLIQEKVKFTEDHPTKPIFSDRILEQFPGLRIPGKVWKEEHDKIMLRAVLKHGYGRWQAIVDDKELGIQELICKELNLPFANLAAAEQAGYQGQNGSGNSNSEAHNNSASYDGGQGSSMLIYRDMQRRLVEFVKKRVLLLERALNLEYADEYYGVVPPSVPGEEPENEPRATETAGPSFVEADAEILGELPKIELISSDEISAASVDNLERQELAQHFNQMCKTVDENARESVETFINNKPVSRRLRENFRALESINDNVNRILSAAPSGESKPESTEDVKADVVADDDDDDGRTEEDNVEVKDTSEEELKPGRSNVVACLVDLNLSEAVAEDTVNVAGTSGGGDADVKMEEADGDEATKDGERVFMLD
ncbi:PREDICTED: CHD3-type chromatin-remodeling factor PICKLE-like [Tarenaya hassleriana]|uniref:CHD3-type chromatin-remodeling factor PICKLE-like n=1 Tax=Tarenaya hassleriana TaxID=28532 RepID=UPI00053C1A84|nr:PREDICTED: CHD3-type chromatin-remodeling factor PICKLE-like [Tarenaya hassleriana]XP_010526238.1 PREDICTED: CHD3-type chromatin-remodeling factor PICKLE-like [Tarenaya hassleriana]